MPRPPGLEGVRLPPVDLGFDPDELARLLDPTLPTTKKLRPKDRPLANDFVSDEAFDALLDAWFGNMARVLDPGRSFYIWGGYANIGNYPPFLKKHGLYFSQGIVWDKQHPVSNWRCGRCSTRSARASTSPPRGGWRRTRR